MYYSYSTSSVFPFEVEEKYIIIIEWSIIFETSHGLFINTRTTFQGLRSGELNQINATEQRFLNLEWHQIAYLPGCKRASNKTLNFFPDFNVWHSYYILCIGSLFTYRFSERLYKDLREKPTQHPRLVPAYNVSKIPTGQATHANRQTQLEMGTETCQWRYDLPLRSAGRRWAWPSTRKTLEPKRTTGERYWHMVFWAREVNACLPAVCASRNWGHGLVIGFSPSKHSDSQAVLEASGRRRAPRPRLLTAFFILTEADLCWYKWRATVSSATYSHPSLVLS